MTNIEKYRDLNFLLKDFLKDNPNINKSEISSKFIEHLKRTFISYFTKDKNIAQLPTFYKKSINNLKVVIEENNNFRAYTDSNSIIYTTFPKEPNILIDPKGEKGKELEELKEQNLLWLCGFLFHEMAHNRSEDIIEQVIRKQLGPVREEIYAKTQELSNDQLLEFYKKNLPKWQKDFEKSAQMILFDEGIKIKPEIIKSYSSTYLPLNPSSFAMSTSLHNLLVDIFIENDIHLHARNEVEKIKIFNTLKDLRKEFLVDRYVKESLEILENIKKKGEPQGFNKFNFIKPIMQVYIDPRYRSDIEKHPSFKEFFNNKYFQDFLNIKYSNQESFRDILNNLHRINLENSKLNPATEPINLIKEKNLLLSKWFNEAATKITSVFEKDNNLKKELQNQQNQQNSSQENQNEKQKDQNQENEQQNQKGDSQENSQDGNSQQGDSQENSQDGNSQQGDSKGESPNQDGNSQSKNSSSGNKSKQQENKGNQQNSNSSNEEIEQNQDSQKLIDDITNQQSEEKFKQNIQDSSKSDLGEIAKDIIEKLQEKMEQKTKDILNNQQGDSLKEDKDKSNESKNNNNSNSENQINNKDLDTMSKINKDTEVTLMPLDSLNVGELKKNSEKLIKEIEKKHKKTLDNIKKILKRVKTFANSPFTSSTYGNDRKIVDNYINGKNILTAYTSQQMFFHIRFLLDGSGSMSSSMGNDSRMEVMKECVTLAKVALERLEGIFLDIYNFDTGHKGSILNIIQSHNESEKDLIKQELKKDKKNQRIKKSNTVSAKTFEEMLGYERLSKIKANGGTPLANTLIYLIQMMKSKQTVSKTPEILYVFSDGEDGSGRENLNLAKKLINQLEKDHSIIVKFVGIGNNAMEKYFGKEHFTEIKSSSDFLNFFEDLIEQTIKLFEKNLKTTIEKKPTSNMFGLK